MNNKICHSYSSCTEANYVRTLKLIKFNLLIKINNYFSNELKLVMKNYELLVMNYEFKLITKEIFCKKCGGFYKKFKLIS